MLIWYANQKIHPRNIDPTVEHNNILETRQIPERPREEEEEIRMCHGV